MDTRKQVTYWKLRANAAQYDTYEAWEVLRMYCKLNNIDDISERTMINYVWLKNDIGLSETHANQVMRCLYAGPINGFDMIIRNRTKPARSYGMEESIPILKTKQHLPGVQVLLKVLEKKQLL